MYQMTLADALNDLGEPIRAGEYVEHKLKLGVPLLVMGKPFKTPTGRVCLKVKLLDGHEIKVLLENVQRY